MSRKNDESTANNHNQRNDKIKPHAELFAFGKNAKHGTFNVHTMFLVFFRQAEDAFGATGHNALPSAHNAWMGNDARIMLNLEDDFSDELSRFSSGMYLIKSAEIRLSGNSAFDSEGSVGWFGFN